MMFEVKELVGHDTGYVREIMKGYSVDCPGCKMTHHISNDWNFNGNMNKPTFTPSVSVSWNTKDGKPHKCHFHITDGIFKFDKDCTHDYAQQSIPMT